MFVSRSVTTIIDLDYDEKQLGDNAQLASIHSAAACAVVRLAAFKCVDARVGVLAWRAIAALLRVSCVLSE